MIGLRDIARYFRDGRDEPPANNEVEIKSKVSDPIADSEPFLADNNVGLGVLSEGERYQNLQAYRDGLYGYAALARTIEDTAKHQAKAGLLDEKLAADDTDIDPPDEFSRDPDDGPVSMREWRQLKREDVWAAATREEKIDAVAEYGGLTRDWVPTHWRMVLADVELSRSQDGRLLGDTVGRTQEVKADVPEEMQGKLGEGVRST